MLHVNDKQNQKKHAKMLRRLKRGVLPPEGKNTGEPFTSKIKPFCRWYQKRIKEEVVQHI